MDYELLLMNVSRDYSGFSEVFRDNIGQYLIASYLRQKNFKAYVYSGDIQGCKSVLEKEVGKKRTAIVGFYAAADNIRVVGHVVQWLKKNYSDCITIIGGPQAIGLDYDFFEVTDNDYAIVGEGEIPMYYLLSFLVDHSLEVTQVPSLVRRDDIERTLIVNKCDNAVIMDLDSIDFPRVEDSLTGCLRQGEVVGIITGRGCPFRCSFCYEGANAKNVRLRSIKNVMAEIDYIRENNKKLNFISIYDDTFTLHDDRILEFCDAMKQRNIMWFCEGYIAFVINKQEVLKKMIESGLACIQFGIESGAENVLNAYNKHTDFDMIVKAIEVCKHLGIHSVTGNFIIGGAFETYDTIEKSKQLARELIHKGKGIIELYAVYFVPYPNTDMTNYPEKYDIEIHEELKEININTMRTSVVSTKVLTRNEIYDVKHDFDEFMKEEYIKAGDESRKADILQGLFHNGRRISVNPTWERIYLGRPHISLFLEHMSNQEQYFDKGKYIIRTFEDVKISGDKLVSDVGIFQGIEKSILVYATGVYTAEEMAGKFHVTIEEIENTYYDLNDRCLVYMAEF